MTTSLVTIFTSSTTGDILVTIRDILYPCKEGDKIELQLVPNPGRTVWITYEVVEILTDKVSVHGHGVERVIRLYSKDELELLTTRDLNESDKILFIIQSIKTKNFFVSQIGDDSHSAKSLGRRKIITKWSNEISDAKTFTWNDAWELTKHKKSWEIIRLEETI